MIRLPQTPGERERGRTLGRILREARGGRTVSDVAAGANISPETLRKIESGRISSPAFFTVASLCRELGLSADALADGCDPEPSSP
ncbi:helix-turn-helix domain-containing protein [Salininema proteolyticum]|uniref:Helix-turn-helix domain-containing protein n=1 Tax=Salininema proteolyticum TaxID=1607685 RepID=A0ABV8U0G0_9ACTN